MAVGPDRACLEEPWASCITNGPAFEGDVLNTDGVNLSTVQENEEQNLDSRDYFDLIKEESTGHCD